MAFGFVNLFLAAGVMIAVTLGLYGQTSVLGSVAYKAYGNTDAMLDALALAEQTSM